jgi:hypothetical protein
VLQSTIGKYKNRTSDWGIERLFIVEAVKEASLPLKQIQVSRREFSPRRALAVPSHSFMDEKQIRPRNGLVVQTSLSLRKGVSPERVGKLFQSVQSWITSQIFKCEPNVVRVMERVS